MANIWKKLKYIGWFCVWQFFYYGSKVLYPFCFLPWAWRKVSGKENVPKGKVATLVIVNHLSMWDIPYTYPLLPRPFFMMGKAEYFNVPFMGFLVRGYGGFPVKRGEADRPAIQHAVDLLKKQQLLVIYPEGTRSKTGGMGEGQAGALMIAQHADPIIVPAAIYGTEKIAKKRKGFFSYPTIHIKAGKPFRLNDLRGDIQPGLNKRAQNEEMLDLMMRRIAEQLPPEYQGLYAPDLIAQRRIERLQAQQAENERRAAKRLAKVTEAKE